MAVQQIHYDGPVAQDNYGVLSCFVQIPCDNTPQEAKYGELTYQEKFKGPYSSAKEVLSRVTVGMGIDYAHNHLGTIVKRFEHPAVPERNALTGFWQVESIRVQEQEAGEHAIVTIDYQANYGTEGDVGQFDPYADVWSMSWQAYTVSPYAFCKNDTWDDVESLNWSPSDEHPFEDWSKSANREYIEKAINSPNFEVKGNFIVYTPDVNQSDYRKYLHPACFAIRKKVACDRNAIYHTPVIVHQSLKRFNVISATYNTEIGSKIDHICEANELSGCPYTFPQNTWQFIKVGDDMTQTKTLNGTTYTRREVWNGYPYNSIDKNYYGNGEFSHDLAGIADGRWPIGGV